MRFKDDLLTVNLCGFSSSDILKMSVNEAIINLANYPKTRKNLSLLQDVGLGYLPLGQPLNTLSEVNHKGLLVKYMGAIKNEQNPSILLVDEPTTGLHMSDIEQLLNVFDQVTSQGHTLLVIEHNAQVLRHSDWIWNSAQVLERMVAKLSPKVPQNHFEERKHILQDFFSPAR